MERNTDVLIGLQYGSEGKGIVAGALALTKLYKVFIRTGGSNAGHSFYYRDKFYVFRHIPCGIIAKDSLAFISRGALVDFDVLAKEIQDNNIDVTRVFIDKFTYSIMQQDADFEKEQKMDKNIGSTCKGNGTALCSRIMRTDWNIRKSILEEESTKLGIRISDIKEVLSVCQQQNILIESTQGASLSIYSNHYPKCTSRDISTAGILSDACIPTGLLNNVIGVIRTYPIRVAGDSGYMKNEISWDILSKRIGKDVIERTTVTQKVRRVAEFDWEQVEENIFKNSVTHLVITFMDYLNPKASESKSITELPDECKNFIDDVQRRYRIPVIAVTTGADVEKNFLWFPPYDKQFGRQ